MVSLYAMLFNSQKYDGNSALIFNWDPVFWGMGDEKYEYDRMSLQNIILHEMERENWLGVCCEPNCIFVACNQFPVNRILIEHKYRADWLTKFQAHCNTLQRCAKWNEPH